MTATTTNRRSLADLVDEVQGRVACLAMSKDPNAKVTVLLFSPGEPLPGRVAKVPTTDAAAERVEAEARALDFLAGHGPSTLGGTVPRVVAHAEHRGRPVLVTTALPGRVMLASYHAWRHTARPSLVRADFEAAGGWLAGLQEHASGATVDLARVLDGVAGTVGRRFGDDPWTAADLVHLAALEGRLAGHPVTQVAVHGDFWPGNILLQDGRVRGVVDWESFQARGLPTRDLARFMVTYSLYLDRHTRTGRRVAGHPGLRSGPFGAGVIYAVDGTGWYPELARRFIGNGLRRLGLPPELGRDVVLAELAAIAAEADDPEFAKHHLVLFRHLCRATTP